MLAEPVRDGKHWIEGVLTQLADLRKAPLDRVAWVPRFDTLSFSYCLVVESEKASVLQEISAPHINDCVQVKSLQLALAASVFMLLRRLDEERAKPHSIQSA